MSRPPVRPKLYHITHMDNLPAIAAEGCLVSDAAMIARGGPPAAIGMSRIKARRLTLPVPCHPGDHVGDYVPCYFCARSIMLFVIHCANNPDLTYRGGQRPIVHLEFDLQEVLAWASGTGIRWAFSLSNAGAAYAQFRASTADLKELEWSAIQATDFRTAEVKEAKQAEFLIHGSLPWSLVSRIGVMAPGIQSAVQAALAGVTQCPPVVVVPGWYF